MYSASQQGKGAATSQPTIFPARKRRFTPYVLVGILILAAGLRLWGAFYDLPYIFHPDEPVNIDSIQNMIVNGDANPHDFRYPALMYDVDAVVGGLYFKTHSVLTGTPISLHPPLSIAMGSTYAPSADAVVVFRTVTICAGLLAVLVTFFVGGRVFGHDAGVGAALLVAISPILVAEGRFVTPDTWVVLFSLLTILWAVRIVQSGQLSAYVLSGIAIGATAAAKYNGAIVCVAVVAAHFVHYGVNPREWWRLAFSGAVSILAFIAVMPFAILDFHGFMEGWTRQVGIYGTRHDGMEGNALFWYLSELWSTCGVAIILAICELIRLARAKEALPLVAVCFGVLYLLFIGMFNLRNDRTLLPVVPCVALLASSFIVFLWSKQSALLRVSPTVRSLALIALGVALVVTPLRVVIERTLNLTRIDSRTTAREWINSNLPEHSRVAVESYSPYVDPARFSIFQSERAIDHAADWYADNGIEYVVLSQGLFGRYFTDPQRHAAEILRYQTLMRSLTLVRAFDDGGYSVLVYRTGTNG
jgi:4-amino-4-deoxy-L-arabinose transferase-like glycosyltransferase